TELGREGRRGVERQTDALAAAPWRALGPRAGRLAELLGPAVGAIVQSGLLPMQSTLGLLHEL
ncbi:helix-turn-helix domain-containing protein, partial [Pseudonocardia lacus]|uniref:helix-turn-helix domain-containing protein n=1 Tax=Pseudonocardia lacus TaxID=2835865 RepID=UPI0038B5DEBB